MSIKRLCSSESTFQKHLENLKTWLYERGYPQKVVDDQIKRVSEKGLHKLFERPDKKETGVPLVVLYHPRLRNLSASIRKYFTFLYAEEKVKNVLRNHLVRDKVYPLIREKDTFCCGKSRCESCCNRKQTETFENFMTKKVYKIIHSFNCYSKSLIYHFSRFVVLPRFVVFSM